LVSIEEIQTVYYMVAATGVIGTLTAAFIAVRTYINTNKRAEEARRRELETRQAQMFMQVYNQNQNSEFNKAITFTLNKLRMKTYEEFLEMCGDEERFSKFRTVGSLYEGLGVLVKRGLVDASMVDDLMSMEVLLFWELHGPFIKEYRVKEGAPTTSEWTEYLYGRLKEIAVVQHPELKT
jgi:hypothetical protein